jgi:hypothetical protein
MCMECRSRGEDVTPATLRLPRTVRQVQCSTHLTTTAPREAQSVHGFHIEPSLQDSLQWLPIAGEEEW